MVLIAADGFQPWDLASYLTNCLKDRGTDVRTFHYRFGERRQTASEQLLAAVRQSKPDVVLGLKLRGIAPDALAEIQAQGVFVALWYPDCFTTRVPGWVMSLARQTDLFATTAHGMVEKYARAGLSQCVWIPEGAYLPAFPRLSSSPAMRRTYGAEVAFVGNVFQPPVADDELALRRWYLLDQLGRRFQVKVWGPQSDSPRARSLGSPSFEIIRWPAYNDELVKICRSSSIVVGINTVNTVHQYFSNRTFVTLASGGFHVTHHVPGLEDLFENHKHLVWFRSDAECVELCAYYLTRPAARRRIAEAGRCRVRNRWSMARQVSRLVRLIGEAGVRAKL